MAPKSIFCFFLDHEVHKLFGIERQYGKERVFSELMMATKLAFLLCEESILVPASNYFESDFSFKLLNSLCAGTMQNLGVVKLVSSSNSLEELLKKKSDEHEEMISREGYHYGEFINQQQELFLPGILIKRERSASSDIRQAWYSNIDSLGRGIADQFPDIYSAKELERTLAQIPTLLEKRAFISKYLLPFFKTSINNEISFDNFLNRFITTEYIRSFLDEYDAVCLCNIPVLESADRILPPPPQYKHLSYKTYLNLLVQSNYLGENAYRFVQRSSLDDLFFFKISNSWKDLYERSVFHETEPKRFYFLTQSKEDDNMSNDLARIGIITALPKEYAAMKLMLSNCKEVYNNKRGNAERYLIGQLPSADNKTHVVVLMMCGEGNNNAAIRCTQLINVFQNIKAIVMCGIAGGIPHPSNPKEHVRLGDIVVSDTVFQYDYGKEKGDSWEPKAVSTRISPSFSRAIDKLKADEYEGRYEWKKYISEYANGLFSKPDESEDKLFDQTGNVVSHPIDIRRNGFPIVHYGCIASANTVLKNPTKREELRDNHHALAVEMEGSGIADATTDENAHFVIVRGICDYCDTHKNDIWQEYAAIVAASYTRCLIETLPSFE